MNLQRKSMPSPRKGKARENPARARRVARKRKESTQAKVTEKRQLNTVETGKYGHNAADCWYKQPNKSQGKGKGTGKS